MKKYEAIRTAAHPEVIVYGGHPSLISPLLQRFPGLLKVVNTTRHSLDTSSFKNYKLIIIFTTNISHSSYYSTKAAAKRAGVPVHTMISKGSSTSASELIDVLSRLA